MAPDALAATLAARAGPGRSIVAIAGPPGSGKTTLTASVEAALTGTHGLCARSLQMDGFHYDNAVLDSLGLRARKGAPETFDTDGLAALLARLAAGDAPDIAVPAFDRTLDLTRACATIIGREARMLVVEGNYLLLNRPPWQALQRHFTCTVALDCAEDTLRARLMQRWRGLGHSESAARTKVEQNDLPNARLVLHHSRPADILVSCPGAPG
ncbi:hypothetical protein FDP22_22315 (plasmid) [Paroceanicella profunda]|uniref:Nucleoside/nucleotide kinase family protein n=1 Tax=Paroceanicella profunda TaxID=2579971 RepID=A0A5B8G3X4_9RHOB|nr:hypothetical protein FDP22_22315 [Paroceanicella profunda]